MTEERFEQLIEERKELLEKIGEIDREIEKAGRTFDLMDRSLA